MCRQITARVSIYIHSWKLVQILYLNGVEENFSFIAGVEVVTNRLKMQNGIRAKKKMYK